jgi:anti-anti-sigma regulatory factor
MHVKIDTKERFHVITPQGSALTDNMAGELAALLTGHRETGAGNLILNLSHVTTIEPAIGSLLAREQQASYEMQRSFVICCLHPDAESSLDALGVLELLNLTPTESEAWDIVQMEVIERELLD